MGAKGAYLIPLFLLALVVQTTALFGGDVKVRGYTRKDGTYVAPHTRSRPNALKWDNKSYTPSQPAYNKSYYAPKKKYSPKWRQPSETRFQDDNPYNDAPPANAPLYRRSNTIKPYSPPRQTYEYKPKTPQYNYKKTPKRRTNDWLNFNTNTTDSSDNLLNQQLLSPAPNYGSDDYSTTPTYDYNYNSNDSYTPPSMDLFSPSNDGLGESLFSPSNDSSDYLFDTGY